MTATDIAREADWGSTKWFFAALRLVGQSADQAVKPPRLLGPLAAAKHAAFTVALDAERLDIGLAATMDKHRRMAG